MNLEKGVSEVETRSYPEASYGFDKVEDLPIEAMQGSKGRFENLVNAVRKQIVGK